MTPNEYSYYLQLERQLTVIQAESNRLLEVWRTRDAQRLEQIQHLEERLTLARWVRRQMHGTNRRQWETIKRLLDENGELRMRNAKLSTKAASYDELTAPEDAPNG